MKKTLLMIAIGAALASSTFAAGIITTYTTLSSWQTAVGGISTDTFTGSPAVFTTFNLVGTTPDSYVGFSSQFYGVGTNQPAGGPTPSHAFINSGVFQDVVDTLASSCNCALTTTFSLNGGTPVFGIFGNWQTGPNGAGQGIKLTAVYSDNSTAVVTVDPSGAFGFTSSTAFTSLLITSNNENPGTKLQETYTLDNLAFATTNTGGQNPPPPSVPEPTTLSMMGVALVGLGAIARKRRS